MSGRMGMVAAFRYIANAARDAMRKRSVSTRAERRSVGREKGRKGDVVRCEGPQGEGAVDG
jgi:hypothetical protein